MVEKMSQAAPPTSAAPQSRWLGPTRRALERRPVRSSLALAVVVLTADYLTGRAIQFPIVYAVPLGLLAWKQRPVLAYAGALLLPTLRLLFHFPWHEMESLTLDAANLPITAFSLSLFIYLIDRMSRQTQELRKRLRKLEGILHICASCKRIRNADGMYEQLESYITDHSEALFSHGLCPDCLPKYL